MTTYFGYAGQVLEVDLTSKQINISPLDLDLARNYIGGRGFNSARLYELTGPATDPRGPENVVMFGIGPLNGTLTCMGSRFNVSGKSPHTGILGDANAGGHFGSDLKYAGFDQIIITGKADKPVYLLISDDHVEIKDASHLWGRDVTETNLAIKQELGDNSIQIATIGPAAENGVSFAGVYANMVRAAARTGMGTVMGSKNLKAVAVRGTKPVRLADPEALYRLDKQLNTAILEHPDFSSRAKLGTPRNTIPLNLGGFLVTKHFQTAFFENAEALSGELLAEKYNMKNKSCHSCPLHCSRFAVIKDGPFAGFKAEGPEYETIAGFGSRCMNDNIEVVLKCNDMANRFGMDTITTSEMISWMMELYERGDITREEADGLDLSWGNTDTIMELIRKIAYREGIGDVLADGVRKAAERLNRGADIAMHVKGLEIIQAEPRGMKGYALGFAVATRGGDHLRAEPFFELHGDPAFGIEKYGIGETALRLEHKGKGILVKDSGDWCAVSDALNVCKNTMVCMEIAEYDVVAELMKFATGLEFTADEVQKCGERIWNIEHAYNVRLGLDRSHDTLPARFQQEPLPEECRESAGSTVDLEPMLDEYYEQRGWDVKTGRPTRAKLEELGLGNVADDLGL